MKRAILASIAPLTLLAAGCAQANAAESIVAAPVPSVKASEGEGLKTAIFAGGCFWGVEAVFSHVKGVRSAVSGYHGGTKRQASYKLVSGGVTNHVEAVRVVYDPSMVRYDQLLQVFFSVIADPTLKNRQGPDRGRHYNAELIPTSSAQASTAKAYLQQMKRSGKWSKPIVTDIVTAGPFYPAENYHQDFAAKNPNHGYIRQWDAPKVAGLKRLYPDLYRSQFVRD